MGKWLLSEDLITCLKQVIKQYYLVPLSKTSPFE